MIDLLFAHWPDLLLTVVGAVVLVEVGKLGVAIVVLRDGQWQ